MSTVEIIIRNIQNATHNHQICQYMVCCENTNISDRWDTTECNFVLRVGRYDINGRWTWQYRLGCWSWSRIAFFSVWKTLQQINIPFYFKVYIAVINMEEFFFKLLYWCYLWVRNLVCVWPRICVKILTCVILTAINVVQYQVLCAQPGESQIKCITYLLTFLMW